MKIDIIPSAKYADRDLLQGSVPVVIDVLRATTVMVTAFENGVKNIIPVLSPEEAFEIKKRLKHDVILGGERDAEMIPGFDLDNSPYSYTEEVVRDKTLVITTTNGTSAIRAASYAGDVYITSFLNARAVAEELSDEAKDEVKVNLVCSGTNGNYTLEDGLCAGYIIDLLKKQHDVELTDFAHLVHTFYLTSKADTREAASSAKHYKILANKGFEKDLEFCFRMNKSRIVPVFSEGVITKKQAKP